MPRFDYLHLDVFTARGLEGNQLAVLTDARGLETELMQAIAREMNFSETTFILPPERGDTDVRMRIFTPRAELLMAGHPTIGSAFALAHTGALTSDRDHLVFGLGVGPTRVELSWSDGMLVFAWMDQPLPDVRPPAASLDEVLAATGADRSAYAATGLPIEEISCGVPYLMLPLASRAAVDAAAPDLSALDTLPSAFGGHTGVYLFSTERAGDDATVYSRMFAGGLGIAEDPATGSACGPLGAYLVRHEVVSGEAARKMVVLQGVSMGRPSRIHVAMTEDPTGAITRVQVGGQAVVVAEGTLMI